MKKTHAGRLSLVVLAAALVVFGFCFAPMMARAEGTLSATQRTEAEINALVESMLASCDYVEGEAIVCFLGEGDSALRVQSDGPLANAERLSEVTARQYSEATGESLPARCAPDTLTAQSESEPVEILLVRADDMSTEQLLHELLSDPRVLSAEPNYIMQFGSVDEVSDESTDVETDGDMPVYLPSSESDASADLVSNDDDAPAPPASDNDDEVPFAPPAETDTETLVSQGSELGSSVSTDLTPYQWFSVGVEDALPQYPNASNPGVHAPNWNEPGVTNASGVVVIMDSGVDYNHPDLENVMYHFSPELQAELGCGEFGYAPRRPDPTDPMDGFGHGTHCAGIVAAEWNDFGVSGIANGVEIVAVSVTESVTNSLFSYDAMIKGYDFIIRAVEAGVDIRAVNRSLVCAPANNANEVIIRAAGEVGVITCIASGNDAYDTDVVSAETVMSQPNPYVLRIDSADLQDSRAIYSNYGKYTTDLFAPGTAILSTIPSQLKSMSRYFPQADDGLLALKTDFSDALLDTHETDETTINSVSEGGIGVDGDSSSLKVNISTQTEMGSSVYVDVPIGDYGKDDIEVISVAVNACEFEARSSVCVLLDDGEYSDFLPQEMIEVVSDPCQGGWVFASLHVHPEEFDQEFGYVTDSQGNRCLRLKVSTTLLSKTLPNESDIDVDFYIDQIAVGTYGNSGYLPYMYMSGTSMVCPVVSASAAIVSSTIEDASPAERAATTVRMLKGAVLQAGGYYGLCKQNGQLDLSMLGSEDSYAPVIASARVEGDTLVVEGSYFTSAGTLFMAGDPVEVLSWSDDVIEAKWPEGFTSGLIPLTVRTDTGAEACRAIPLEAPDTVSGSADLYERDLASLNLRGARESIVRSPLCLCAAEDGTLFAVVSSGDDVVDPIVSYLLRSDDQGASWTCVELPRPLQNVRLAVGEGKAFVLGSTPEDPVEPIEAWHLYGLGIADGSATYLGSYEDGGDVIGNPCNLAYVQGHLYLVDVVGDEDDYYAPVHMRFRRFDDGYSGVDEGFTLSHEYDQTCSYYSPLVSMSGSSVYVCGIGQSVRDEVAIDRLVGLERLDVAADGSLTSEDLTGALSGIGELKRDDVCIAASKGGVFLIGAGLEGLLPEDAAHTDTFFLKRGAAHIEPYPRTLSFSPLILPSAVCSDDWLYAYATSKFEGWTVFGRATKLADEGESKPDTPEENGDANSQSSKGTLPKTGDALVETIPASIAFAIIGSACVAFGLRARTEGDHIDR